jgi:hypothetical protein
MSAAVSPAPFERSRNRGTNLVRFLVPLLLFLIKKNLGELFFALSVVFLLFLQLDLVKEETWKQGEKCRCACSECLLIVMGWGDG